MKRLFLAFLCMAASLVADEYSIQNQVILISRTRSGRNWYQYAIGKLSGQRVSYLVPSTLKGLKLNSKHLFCTHASNLGPYISPKKNKLILTLRNYKEIFARQTRRLEGDERTVAMLDPKLYKDYVDYIRCFDAWLPAMRHLFYYEDMMNQPELELCNILKFIDEPISQLKNFMENLDCHIAQSIADYDKKIKYSITKGKDNFYHTRNLPLDVLRRMDKMMKECAGPLYDQYLKRYEEPSDLM